MLCLGFLDPFPRFLSIDIPLLFKATSLRETLQLPNPVFKLALYDPEASSDNS